MLAIKPLDEQDLENSMASLLNFFDFNGHALENGTPWKLFFKLAHLPDISLLAKILVQL